MAAGIGGGKEQLGVEGIGGDLTTKGLPAGGSVEGEPSVGISGECYVAINLEVFMGVPLSPEICS
uniref:Uncharacterized protein n=1 Tax=Oryza glaberrima TaxID=4538 RepID=I1NYV6_ORYGL